MLSEPIIITTDSTNLDDLPAEESIEPGPIETRFQLDEQLLQQIADTEILFRMRIERPNEHETVRKMVNKLQNATTRLIRWNFDTYGRSSANEQQIIEISEQFVAPKGWVGLIAYERLWRNALKIEDLAARCEELELILHWLIHIQAKNEEDELNFGVKLNPLNDHSNEIIQSLSNARQDDIPDAERETKLTKIWNDCITILTAKPKAEEKTAKTQQT